jgi:hypothetical protein
MLDLLIGVLVSLQDRQYVLVHNRVAQSDKLIAEQHGQVVSGVSTQRYRDLVVIHLGNSTSAAHLCGQPMSRDEDFI